MNGWVLAAALIFLTAVQRMILSKWGLKGLSYTRRFSVPSAFEGEETELIEIIRNDRPLFLPWLRAESRFSPHLRLGKQDNLSVSGDRYHKSIFTLRPFQQITRRHRVLLMRRGVYDVGNVTLTLGDIAGGVGKDRTLYTAAQIAVYPRLLADSEIPLPVSKLQGDLIVRRYYASDPFLINGIRDYRAGDSIRDIHWPATAKTGMLQIKTHDYTADTRLLIVINVQMSESQWGDLMEYEQALIERAISLAATLSLRLLREDVAVGFAANMPFNADEKPAILLPEGYRDREEELLQAFARLKIKRCRNFLSFLDDLSFLRETDILVLSPYTSDLIEEKLTLLRAAHNTVSLFLMEGDNKA